MRERYIYIYIYIIFCGTSTGIVDLQLRRRANAGVLTSRRIRMQPSKSKLWTTPTTNSKASWNNISSSTTIKPHQPGQHEAACHEHEEVLEANYAEQEERTQHAKVDVEPARRRNGSLGIQHLDLRQHRKHQPGKRRAPPMIATSISAKRPLSSTSMATRAATTQRERKAGKRTCVAHKGLSQNGLSQNGYGFVPASF